jgi:AraC-like DNA-binding protein
VYLPRIIIPYPGARHSLPIRPGRSTIDPVNGTDIHPSILVRARPGLIAVAGAALDTSLHAHHAVQVTVQLASPHLLVVGDVVRNETLEVVPSDVPHMLQTPRCLLLLIEPESDAGAAILRSGAFVDGSPSAGESLVGAVKSILERDPEDLPWAVAGEILRRFHVDLPTARLIDDRVLRVIELLDRFETGDGCQKVSLARAAEIAHLSPDRFRHVFRRETGLSWRRYLLWRRLIGAVRAIADARNATDAAYATGFADAAHLTRTCRAMFGVTPSVLAKVGRFVED